MFSDYRITGLSFTVWAPGLYLTYNTLENDLFIIKQTVTYSFKTVYKGRFIKKWYQI